MPFNISEICYNFNMNERDFVEKKRRDWDRLAELVELANGLKGPRALDREEVQELGPLYRRVSTDLSYAKLHATSADLQTHLNSLVGRAHALMFESENAPALFRILVPEGKLNIEGKAVAAAPSAIKLIFEFYLNEFPQLLQKRFKFFFASLMIAVLGGIFGYWLLMNHPDQSGVFIPDNLKSSMEGWKDGTVQHEGSAGFAGQLMTHNQMVGVITFAGGVAGGIPSVYMLFGTGGMIGAMSAMMTQVHRHNTFWPGILPHGFAEVSALLICGAAGLLIGTSLIMPGEKTRADSFRLGGLEACKLVLGTLPMFIFAGFVEGMFSHLNIPAPVRLTFAGINGVLWYLYLFFPRRLKQV